MEYYILKKEWSRSLCPGMERMPRLNKKKKQKASCNLQVNKSFQTLLVWM